MMDCFCPPFVPLNEGPVKSTDEVHVLGNVQSGSLEMFLHPYMGTFVHRV